MDDVSNMKSTYSELVRMVRDFVREKAQEISEFNEEGSGAIRILAYPECKEADTWFGGLGDFSKRPYDIPDYETTFAVTFGGSRVMTSVRNGVEQKFDYYSCSAMKIADCALAQHLGHDPLSGLDLGVPYLTEDNGYGHYYGALCVEVSKHGNPFCGIYVCVSGADPRDDLKCASEAIAIIKSFFAYEGKAFEVKAPDLESLN